MSTQNNFNRFPFVLYDDPESEFAAEMDSADVETVCPEFDEFAGDIAGQLDSLSMGQTAPRYA